MRRRYRAVCPVPCLVVLLLAGAVPAAAANDGVEVSATGCAVDGSCTYTLERAAADYPTSGDMPLLHVVNGPTDSDSAEIDYDLYIPANATALTPQPAIVYFNGFGGSKEDGSGTAIAKYLAGYGYVVLTFSSEGFGNSQHKIELDSPEFDVKNAEALIGVLATKDYVYKDAAGDPRVGLTGGSYGGAIQLMTAEFDPRVDVITPFRTWNSLQYALVPNNLESGFIPQLLPCCGVAKFEWTSLFFASGLTQPFTGHGDGVQGTFLDPNLANRTCPGFDARLCPIYTQSAAEGSGAPAAALLDNSSPSSYFTAGTHSFDVNQHSFGLHVPTLIGQGESDTLFNLNDAVASYLAAQRSGVPVKMIWHAGGHGYSDQPGEGDVFGNGQVSPATKYLPPRILAWFDRYLRNDPDVDTGPGFAYFRDWVDYPPDGSAAPAYGAALAYPAQGAMTFNLSGTTQLVTPDSTVVAGTAQLVSPAKGQPAAYTETSNFQCPGCTLQGLGPSPFTDIQPSDLQGQFAAYTSQPFTRDVESVGIPTAHLHLGHLDPANPDVIVFGKVYDVDPSGAATLIHRLASAVRVFDMSAPVDLNLLGFAHMFPSGHRVRLEVATTDMTSTSDHLLPDTISITTDPADPSTFSLPVGNAGVPVANPTVAAPSTPGGGLPDTGAGGNASKPLLAGLLTLVLVGLHRRRRRAW
jgi:ABC-2 type transport system ATP-binding protein